MKKAVVYYTRDGSTRAAAELLAQKYEADLFELEEMKKRGKSGGSFVAAGFGAAVGLCSRLKNSYRKEMEDRETIYIGSPVWAGKTVPAVNSFIKTLDVKGKKIVLFTLQADENPETAAAKGMDKLRAKLIKRGAAGFKSLNMHGANPGKTAEKDVLLNQIAARNME